MRKRLSKDTLWAMRKDPRYWKGIIYYNPLDPAVGVPKRSRYSGYTLNFGNPLTYVVIVIIAAIVVFIQQYLN